ncbi:MAG: DUF5615 family PIN-like protein [Cyanobacteria bacterium J06554_11]
MSKILLYIDEDAMDQDFVTALRVKQLDVLTVADVGMLQKSDEEQLAWSTHKGRVLFSFNVKDFYRLHTLWLDQGMSHAGIIIAPQQRYTIGALVHLVQKIAAARSAEDIIGKIEFLSNWASGQN